MGNTKEKIVIIGAGISGLTEGIYGRLAGKSTRRMLSRVANVQGGTERDITLTTAFTG